MKEQPINKLTQVGGETKTNDTYKKTKKLAFDENSSRTGTACIT